MSISMSDNAFNSVVFAVVVAALSIWTFANAIAALVVAINRRELRAKKAVLDQRESSLVANRNALTFIGDEAMIYACPMGIIIEPSPSLCRMFGYRREELVGRNLKILMPEPHASAHDGYLERYRTTSIRHIIGTGGRQLEAMKKDGTIFPILLGISEPVMPTGEKLLLGTIKDVTLEKYQELSQLAKGKK